MWLAFFSLETHPHCFPYLLLVRHSMIQSYISCSTVIVFSPVLAKGAGRETGRETQSQYGQMCKSQAGGGKNGGEGRWAMEILPPGDAEQVSELLASLSSYTGLGF